MRDGLKLEVLYTLGYYDGPILTLVKNDEDYYLLAKENGNREWDQIYELYLISKQDWCSLINRTITLRNAIDRSICWSVIIDGELDFAVGGGEITNNCNVTVRSPINHAIVFDDKEVYGSYLDEATGSSDYLMGLNKRFCY